MKKLKRWTAGVIASFDSVISQIENHESLVTSAIQEMQQAGGRARVQLKRVIEDGKKMRRRITELEEAQDLWKERARKSAKLDEERAMECLRRLKRVQAELKSLEEQELEHTKLEKQLTADLATVDQRLTKLKQQRNIMRTRQSRAEALRAASGEDSSLISEIDDIFERWEVKVSEYEIGSSVRLADGFDDFEETYRSAEEEAELREELQELVGEAQ